MDTQATYTAFAGNERVGSGDVRTMLLQTKARLDSGETAQILIFEDHTGRQVDFDFRGTPEEVVARLDSHPLFAAAPTRPAGPGRPKLGVVCREVALLPRHWEWLEQQPNGISGALRRLVDDARKQEPEKEQARALHEALSRFMTSMAGNFAGYEEALRALYAGEYGRVRTLIADWPGDIRGYIESRLGGG